MTSAGRVKETDPIGFEPHDHSRCVETAISAAEAYCAARNLRFTPVRRATLEILLHEHRALGAYDVLDRLRDAGFGSQPPVAYRALDFLVSCGFVHKIERLNAFIACSHPGDIHSPAFLICRVCDSVGETHSAATRDALGDAVRASGFHVERTTIEALGVCPTCAEKARE